MLKKPRIWARIVVALVIGLACGLASWLIAQRPEYAVQDFSVWWLAAKATIHGYNPYLTVRGVGGVIDHVPIFYYPIPTALLVAPLTWLPVVVAGSLFVGLSCGLLAFAVTSEAWWPLLIFTSSSLAMCVTSGQMSALITAGFFLPSLAWLGAFKPNIGLAILAYRPSLRSVAVMAVICLASLVVRPHWPLEWVDAVRRSIFHVAPWQTPGGAVLLLSLLRWKRPEARMLAVLSLVPSSPVVYDALPLFAIPRSKNEMIVLSILSSAVWWLMYDMSFLNDHAHFFARGSALLLWLMYVPSLVMVLRRPNEGELPALFSRSLPRLSVLFRGARVG